jgi:predicted RNase H-like nuclease (RuvC/YqgF family)
MSKDPTKTVRIRKIDKVAPDHRGRSVWLGKVEPVELELVSTTALEKILKSGGDGARGEIRKLAEGRKNGVLAREAATGHFRILSEADLRKAAPLSEATIQKADELSLVSTQVLRKVMPAGDKAERAEQKRAGKKDKFGGFNPYDNG